MVSMATAVQLKLHGRSDKNKNIHITCVTILQRKDLEKKLGFSFLS